MNNIAKLTKTLEEYEIDLTYFNNKFNGIIDWGLNKMYAKNYTPIGMKFFSDTVGKYKTYKTVGLEIMNNLNLNSKDFVELKIDMGSVYNDDSETYSGCINLVRLIIKK